MLTLPEGEKYVSIENFKFSPSGNGFRLGTLVAAPGWARKAAARADLPIQGESPDSQAGAGNAGRGL